MNATPPPRPTEAELEILQILWAHGPQSVRFVNDRLNQVREVGYTTTLKFMQLMHEKGFLSRRKVQRSHIYYPELEQEATQQALLSRFVRSAFGGSATKLVMQALGQSSASAEELNEIRDLLDRLEGGAQ